MVGPPLSSFLPLTFYTKTHSNEKIKVGNNIIEVGHVRVESTLGDLLNRHAS